MTALALADLQATPNALASHYSRFRVGERLLLTGHSHQAWPDVAMEGQVEAFEVAAELVDGKWERAFAKADEVRDGYRRLLGDAGGVVALAANVHELLVRFLSCLDLRARPRLVTSDGEFHSLRRQLARLAEEGVEVVRVPVDPVETLAERLAEEIDDRTGAALVSAVLFETARIVPNLGALAAACQPRGVELFVDAYHALGIMPFPIHAMGLSSAWVAGGGYKYLQLGEGNCALRLPEHAYEVRPTITGWFAEFGEISDQHDSSQVLYAPGGDRFAGGTYDATSNYRAARVFRFFTEHSLTPDFLRASYLHQRDVLAQAFDALDLPDEVITRDRSAPSMSFGGFLALRSAHAHELQQELLARGVSTDSRGDYLRLGPAPYLSDWQLEAAITSLGEAVSAARS